MTEDIDSPALSLADLPLLLEAAFDAARVKGKADWQRMTTAVLKNRLLQMTDRRFDVGALGFPSLGELLAQFPDLVRLDYTTQPTTVEFLGGVPAAPAREEAISPRRLRIRDDLWNAVLNYSAGHEWVWDSTTGHVRPRKPDEPEPLVMPTMSYQDLADLRSSFATEVRPSLADEREISRLEQWRAKGLGTAALPPPLQPLWNERLKSVVVNRLETWFAEHDIPVPGDLVNADAAPAPRQTDEELTRLRTLVIDCVRSMTLSELASLTLPAGAVLRAEARHGRRRDAS